MKTHVLKTWPEHWDAVEAGLKTFEWRRDDRGYAVGDIPVLRRFDPSTETYDVDKQPIYLRVTHLLRGPSVFGIPEGYVVMSIRLLGT